MEALGINDRKQLAAVAAIQRRRTLDRLMEDGVTIIDPASTYIEETVTIGPDTVVYPNVVIEGDTTHRQRVRHRRGLPSERRAVSPIASS